MKATVDLPAELLQTVKIRAVQENRKLKDMIAELLRRGLASPAVDPQAEVRHQVTLPLVRTAHPAAPEAELTPQRVADILEAQEAGSPSR